MSTITLPEAVGGGGGGGGITSINGDTTAAQLIVGTTNRVTVGSSGGTTTIDISASYVGQSSITTLGTVSTGTWSATTIALNKGGTGQTTKAPAFDALSPMTTSGDIIYGGASGTGTRLAKGSDGQFLTLTSGLPAWATVSATPGSPTTSVQFNNAGSFAGDSNLVWDNTNKFLGIGAVAQDPLGIRSGANNNFAVSGPISISGNGVAIHAYNDAKNANVGLEVRATKTVWTVGGIGIQIDPPTAYLEVRGSNGSAGGAAFKMGSGTLLATPESGAFEYDGTHVYFDIGSTRYQLDQQGTTAAAAAPATSLQFNTAGLLDGSANLVWNGNTVSIINPAAATVGCQTVLTLTGSVDTGGNTGPMMQFLGAGSVSAVIGAIQCIAESSAPSMALAFLTYPGGGPATEVFRFAPTGGLGVGGTNYGTSGQVLISGGAGAPVAWGNLPVAGSDTQIQFNNSGAFGASANLTWDDNAVAITNTAAAASGGQIALSLRGEINGVSFIGGPVIQFLGSLAYSGELGAIQCIGEGFNLGTALVFKNYLAGGSSTETFRINEWGAFAIAGAANFGTSGQFLISQGNYAAPIWSNLPSSLTISGNIDAGSYTIGGTSPAADGTYTLPTSITIKSGIITAIS